MNKIMKIFLALALVFSMTLALASCDMLPDELRATIDSLLGNEPDNGDIGGDVDPDGEKDDSGKNDDDAGNGCKHTPGDWFIEVYASCQQAGLRKQYCKLCWTVLEEEVLPQLDTHDYNFGTCKVCGHVQTESVGLEYGTDSNGDTIVVGIGDCTDTSLYISATAPDGTHVVGIKDNAFKGQKEIITVIIEDGVESIGAGAFNGATKLDRVNIPDSILTVGDKAFNECPISVAIIPAHHSAAVSNANIVNVTLTGTQGVPASAFLGRNKLSAITIKEGVSSIGENAFAKTAVSNLTVPGSIKSISARAFDTCMSLSVLTIKEGVMSIEDYAFQNCSYLKAVNLPESLEYIAKRAFYRCPRITKAVFANPTGWIATTVAGSLTGEILAANILANPEEAAACLVAHDEYYIKRIG